MTKFWKWFNKPIEVKRGVHYLNELIVWSAIFVSVLKWMYGL